MKTTLLPYAIGVFLCCWACEAATAEPEGQVPAPVLSPETQPRDSTVATRFPPPTGFTRDFYPPDSYAHYLRHFPLKPAGTRVRHYDGSEKGNQLAHVAVLDIDPGQKDLQQCADAIMRLRAEYLFGRGRYADIHFELTNGFKVGYQRWRRGDRVSVSGNTTRWVNRTGRDTSYAAFRAYLEFVFTYAGTLSLHRELPAKPVAELAVGDVIVQGGSPGHAVTVVDVAVNHGSGEKVFLLAQSYLPAQDIHLLRNPASTDLSPWYAQSQLSGNFRTPEWTFRNYKLAHF